MVWPVSILDAIIVDSSPTIVISGESGLRSITGSIETGLKSIEVLSTVCPSESINAAEIMHSPSTKSDMTVFGTEYCGQ